MRTLRFRKSNREGFEREATERWPLYATVLYSIALLALLFYLLCRGNIPLSDFLNRTVGAVIRFLLAKLTAWIPFSLAECLLILSPLLLTVLIVYGVRRRNRSIRAMLCYLGSVLSIFSLLFSVFVFGFAPGYTGTPLDRKLALERKKCSKEELYETLVLLVEEINRAGEDVLFLENGFSVMPYSYAEMNDRLLEAYGKVSEEYSFLQNFKSTVKPVLFSKAMSYTHITGVYSYFTGEANINIDFPDYTIPYTAAHELAHQRGVAKEDEANFVAFLVCAASEDPYIRYSGYLNLYEYVASALAGTDRELYLKARSGLRNEAIKEMQAYNEFFKQYQHSAAGKVSETVNNTYLQVQGTPGTKSYGMVVDLAVAYYRSK